MEIEELKLVKVCKECAVLFIPKKDYYYNCPQCFEGTAGKEEQTFGGYEAKDCGDR